MIGVVLWAITYAVNRFVLHQDTRHDPERLADDPEEQTEEK